MPSIAEGVICCGRSKLVDHPNIARDNFANRELFLASWRKHLADAFLRSARQGVDARVAAQDARKDPEVGDFSHIRISHRLEYEGCEGSGRISVQCLLGVIRAHRHNLLDARIGHECEDRVHEWPHTHIVHGRAAEDRDDLPVCDSRLQTAIDFLCGQLLTFEVLHDEIVIALSRGLDKLSASRLHFGCQVARNIGGSCALAQEGFHRDEVNHPFELGAFADRNLYRHDSAAEDLAQVVHHALELRVLAIHFVDENDAG